MTRECGYTLLELLVVLAIMGIMFAAIPGAALPGINAARFSGKIQRITLRLEQAHEEAVNTGETVIVTTSELSSPGCQITPDDSGATFYPDGSSIGKRLLVMCGGRSKMIFVSPLTGVVSVLNDAR